MKNGAGFGIALGTNSSAMSLYNLLDNGEPQPDSTLVPLSGHPVKLFKKVLQMFRNDTLTAVCNRKPDVILIFTSTYGY